MGVIGKFIDPIISAALQKKREKMLSPDDGEEDTLLQHLVRQTSGMLFGLERLNMRLMRPQITSLSKMRRLTL